MSLIDAAARLKSAWDTFAREVAKPARRAFCGDPRVWWNGVRRRTASVRTDDGNAHLVDVRCRRVKCGNRTCRKTWALRPPGLAAHRHYKLCIVASATSTYLFDPEASQATVAQANQCSERTMGRWIRWVGQLADPATIQRKVLEAAGHPVLTPVREVANLARKARHATRPARDRRAHRRQPHPRRHLPPPPHPRTCKMTTPRPLRHPRPCGKRTRLPR